MAGMHHENLKRAGMFCGVTSGTTCLALIQFVLSNDVRFFIQPCKQCDVVV